ncbi:MAG: ribonuclease J [Alphaproteobacteria bacterium]
MSDTLHIPRDRLVFIPLGGAGEIGMNVYLYGYAGKWLMIDLGITFHDDVIPTINVVLPDLRFIEEQSRNLLGLVVTHGHEDHLGAIPYLWPRLKCPVYATPFAAALINSKTPEILAPQRVPVSEIPLGHRFDLGPFDLELVTLTHSIPEPNAVILRTPAGTVVHSGDWKFDPYPMIGPVADVGSLRRAGREGVLALIGDSTNVFVSGRSGSESMVRDGLIDLVGDYTGRIAVTCFASNVARVESIAEAAVRNGRQVALVGRSLWRVVEAARSVGYLADAPRFLTDEKAKHLPADKVLYICTGSQGEPRSALAKIASRTHPCVSLGAGDVVIFSSRVIPGNEKAIFHLQNQLARQGVAVVTDRDHMVHVSGHPARGEMEEMYALLRPRIAIPIHGEMRHLTEHARLAKACGVPDVVVVENGEAVALSQEGAQGIGQVPVGRLAVDGLRLEPWDSEILRSRRRLIYNGVAVVTVVVDRSGLLVGDPLLSAPGLLDPVAEPDAQERVIEAVRYALHRVPAGSRREDESLRSAVRLAVRRSLRESHGVKPLTEVHLVRL